MIDLAGAVSQQVFHCRHCGGITYTSDLEEITLHEPGSKEGDDG